MKVRELVQALQALPDQDATGLLARGISLTSGLSYRV